MVSIYVFFGHDVWAWSRSGVLRALPFAHGFCVWHGFQVCVACELSPTPSPQPPSLPGHEAHGGLAQAQPPGRHLQMGSQAPASPGPQGQSPGRPPPRKGCPKDMVASTMCWTSPFKNMVAATMSFNTTQNSYQRNTMFLTPWESGVWRLSGDS